MLYCRCMYTVPENSGKSVDSSHCWDGVVDMSAERLKKSVSEFLFYMHRHVCRSHIYNVCIIVNTPMYLHMGM